MPKAGRSAIHSRAGVRAGRGRAALLCGEAVGGVGGIGQLQRVVRAAAGHRGGDLVARLKRGAHPDQAGAGGEHLPPGEVRGRSLIAPGNRAELLERGTDPAVQAHPFRGELVLRPAPHAWRGPRAAHLGERAGLCGVAAVGVAGPVEAGGRGDPGRAGARAAGEHELRTVVTQIVGQRVPGRGQVPGRISRVACSRWRGGRGGGGGGERQGTGQHCG